MTDYPKLSWGTSGGRPPEGQFVYLLATENLRFLELNSIIEDPAITKCLASS